MPLITTPGLPALQKQIKTAFDNAVLGATSGSPTSAINEALATEIATAIDNYMKVAKIQVIVNGASAPDASGGFVTGQGTG